MADRTDTYLILGQAIGCLMGEGSQMVIEDILNDGFSRGYIEYLAKQLQTILAETKGTTTDGKSSK